MELKFRAWDKQTRDMLEFFAPSMEFYNKRLNRYRDFFDRHIIRMQFTGLKDKNGVEIYEGDVLKNDYGDLWVVVWNGTGFRLALNGESKSIYSANEYYFSSCEVVGNIFQDGDLLDSEISKVDRD